MFGFRLFFLFKIYLKIKLTVKYRCNQEENPSARHIRRGKDKMNLMIVLKIQNVV